MSLIGGEQGGESVCSVGGAFGGGCSAGNLCKGGDIFYI